MDRKRCASWETRGAFAFSAVPTEFLRLSLTLLLASFVAINRYYFCCIARAKYFTLGVRECLHVGFPIFVPTTDEAFAHDNLTAREAITAVRNDLTNKTRPRL